MSLSIHPRYLDKVTNSTNNPLNWGHLFLTRHTKKPYVGFGNVPLNATPQGGSNFQSSWNQLGGTYASGGPQNFGNAPFVGGFNPSQQGGFTASYTNQPQTGGYT